ncbi:MAG: diaminopimelate decarboxylase [Lachnospiraceae bacterium]|nr:diaminopimelate decarboxylase [Lachnospiraceae bacterium]
MAFVCENISVNEEGVLTFAGQSTEELARQYGTPLYLMDEDRIRQNCRTYVNAFSEHFPEGSMPLFAGKACCFKQIYRIISSENMGCDVVSSGEIFTASEAGMDMEKAFFHGNNKTDADIKFAMDRGVGYFVADNEEEILAIEAEAAARGIVQKVLLRITPGIDPHTYEAVSTGKVDSKFGQAIATGQAEEITALTLRQEHVELAGFHCHVGSQVFAEDVFERASDVMLEFIADMNAKFGYMAGCLNLGGGYGVRYVDSDPYLYIAEKIGSVAGAIKRKCESLDIPVPVICMEPGRSIVADAGMTLYTAGSVKKIPGYKNYVSVDGGMTDNPRYALYKSSYSCYNASRMNEEADMEVTIGGRCCESGDLIQLDVPMPSSTERGDIIAVCTTGAYNYSMSSNYNRIPRPAVVMLKSGSSYVAVRRETFEDVAAQDI